MPGQVQNRVLQDVALHPATSVRELLARNSDLKPRSVHEAIRRLRMQRLLQGTWDTTGDRPQRRWELIGGGRDRALDPPGALQQLAEVSP